MGLGLRLIILSLILIFSSVGPVYAYRYQLASIKFVDLPNSSNEKRSLESVIHEKNEVKNKNKKSKHKKLKKQKVKVASEQKLGPVTLDLKVNPLNRRRNQASFNLDLIESYEIVTHKKKATYHIVGWQDIKKLSSYISRERVSSLIATVKGEFKEVE